MPKFSIGFLCLWEISEVGAEVFIRVGERKKSTGRVKLSGRCGWDEALSERPDAYVNDFFIPEFS